MSGKHNFPVNRLDRSGLVLKNENRGQALGCERQQSLRVARIITAGSALKNLFDYRISVIPMLLLSTDEKLYHAVGASHIDDQDRNNLPDQFEITAAG